MVRAAGPRIILDAELRQALLGETGDGQMTPRAVAAHLVHALAVEAQGAVQVSEPDADVLLFGAALKRG